jgi:PTS system nitrogen regulatory IIA component
MKGVIGINMRIADFISKEAITINIKSTTKKDIIQELVGPLVKARKLKKDAGEKAVKALMDREKRGTTGIGQGVAIPHAKLDKIKGAVLALGCSAKGVEFNALDGEAVHVIFLLLSSKDDKEGIHLKLLAKIARSLKDKFFRSSLKEAKTSEEALSFIEREE